MSLRVVDNEEEIVEIPNETQYWFVRTDGGIYFDTFYERGFIGINWNYITLRLLNKDSEHRVKEMIAQRQNVDPASVRGKTLVSSIYNKVIRFNEMQKGDIVVIPSQGSIELAFGVIEDDSTYWSDDFENECPYYKRRSVKWIEKKELKNLDPKFFEIRTTRHAISNITPYADYIDRATLTFFKKNETATLVLDILQENDIELVPLVNLIDGINKLLYEINEDLKLNEEVDGNVVKLNLQSKGLLAIVSKAVNSLAILGLVWALEACGSVDAEKAHDAGVSEEQVVELHKKIGPQLQEIVDSMDTLHTDTDKLAKVFSAK